MIELDDEQVRRTAEVLFSHWRDDTHIDSLPDAWYPDSVEDGYRVQRRFVEIAGNAVSGWKIAATSRAGQAHIAVTHPLAGPLLSSRTYSNGAAIVLGCNNMQVAEAEIAFCLGRALPARADPYGVDEVMAAVDTLHPAIELPDSRFQEFTKAGAASLIADLACARCFVLGDASRANWRSLRLADCVTGLDINGEQVTAGSGRDALDGPDRALAWLATRLSTLGLGLRAGDVVTTGVCGKPSPITRGDHIEATFGALGDVTARIV